MDTKLFDRWLSHPTDRSKDFVKFHAAIDDRGAAFAIAITDGTTSDTIVLPYLLHDIGAPLGAIRADKGYLSKDNVQCVEDLGALPYIKPKSYSKMLSCGRPAWRHMIFRYRQDEGRFLKEYNQQRRAEAFFSNMKRRFGPSVRSRIGTMRRKDVWMRPDHEHPRGGRRGCGEGTQAGRLIMCHSTNASELASSTMPP